MQFSNKAFALAFSNISEALGSIPTPAGEEKGEKEGEGREGGERRKKGKTRIRK